MKAVAIIPAFNEGERVCTVVQTAIGSALFTRVIVVDDGSTDNTSQAAKDAGAQVISHPKNIGKPGAMLSGIKGSEESVICFLDGDLVNVTTDMLDQLVQPITNGVHQAALAIFSGGRIATTLAQKISPMLSGQRCITRDALKEFDLWDSGFGIETAINSYLQKEGVNQLIVKWEGATHIMKEEKRGFFRGLFSRLKMYWQIFKTWLRTKL